MDKLMMDVISSAYTDDRAITKPNLDPPFCFLRSEGVIKRDGPKISIKEYCVRTLGFTVNKLIPISPPPPPLLVLRLDLDQHCCDFLFSVSCSTQSHRLRRAFLFLSLWFTQGLMLLRDLRMFREGESRYGTVTYR